MDRLLEQKRKGEELFHLKINQFISKSPYAKKQQQLSVPVMSQILQMPFFQGIMVNGKVNVEKLCEKIGNETGCPSRELMRVMGGRREMKVGEVQHLLKSYQLHQFNLQQQIIKLLFDGSTLSVKKLDQLMISLKLPPLNAKDKELMIECFDGDRDGMVTREDIERLLDAGA